MYDIPVLVPVVELEEIPDDVRGVSKVTRMSWP